MRLMGSRSSTPSQIGPPIIASASLWRCRVSTFRFRGVLDPSHWFFSCGERLGSGRPVGTRTVPLGLCVESTELRIDILLYWIWQSCPTNRSCFLRLNSPDLCRGSILVLQLQSHFLHPHMNTHQSRLRPVGEVTGHRT